jgi:RNA polymerase sigma factor (sigma-70 family)
MMRLTGNDELNSAIISHPLLTEEQEMELIDDAKLGDPQSISTLIMNNLRLIISERNKFVRYKGNESLWDDLFAAGILGLHDAIKGYKHGFDTRFGTYAKWYIMTQFHRILALQQVVIIPPATYQTMSNIRKHLKAAGIEFTLDNIFSGICDEIIGNSHTCKKTVISYLMTNSNNITHLDCPTTPDGTLITSDRVPCNKSIDVTADQKREHTKQIESLLDLVDDRSRFILVMRFGLAGYDTHTLEEVSDIVHRTRERVRQIQNKALKKIRESDLIHKII